MKMNAKKVLGMVLAGVLAAGSLTACGGSGNAKTPEPTTAEAVRQIPLQQQPRHRMTKQQQPRHPVKVTPGQQKHPVRRRP